jgi:poly(A) polymerase
MHDIGKIWTRTVNRERKVHFFRHEEFGAMLFLGVAGRLQFDDAFRDRVDYVIRNHSRVNLYDSSWTDNAIRRMIRECGDHMDELVMFSSADFTTKRESKARELRRQLAELHDRMEKIAREDARKPPLPKGIGNAIMEEFSVPPGRELGALRTWLESEIEEGNLAAQADPAIYLKHLSLFPDKIEAAGGSVPTGTDQNV